MIPSISFHDGKSIPQIGLGTSPLTSDEVAPVVTEAIARGYRHVDTAAKYGNEEGVGRGIRDSGIDRGELFVTTKLDGPYQGGDRAIGGLHDSLGRLGLEYVDLLLIHWPLPARGEFVSTWQTFIGLHEQGLARSIGVSNFKPAHLDRLIAETGVVPVINQIQLNPEVTRIDQREYHDAHQIVTESYSPMGSRAQLFERPEIATVAEKHAKTAGQIVLRWHVQNGLVAIPKSTSPERLSQNLDVFDFELDADDLASIAKVDRGPGAGNDSDTVGH
jgi:2,5-diketo-D-gluconate reductase A